MKKIIISLLLIFTIFFIVKEVNADWLADGTCEVNTNCLISRQLVNETTGSPISSASCNITIYSPANTSSVLLNNAPMDNLTNGFYTHTINYPDLGHYPAVMRCDYIGDVDSADVSFTISTREAAKTLIQFPILYILLVSGYGLLIFGFIRREETIVTISSMLLAVAGIFILANGIDDVINWTTNAFGMITLLIGGYFLIRVGLEQLEQIDF